MQDAREPVEDHQRAASAGSGEVVPLPRRAQQNDIRHLFTQTSQRYDRLSGEIRRIETAVRRLAEILKLVLRGPVGAEGADPVIALTDGQAGRLESALGHLASRIGALSQTLEDERERQEREITAFIERTREGLVGVAGRIREGLGELARRQGESQDLLRQELRTELESLKSAIPKPGAGGNGNGDGVSAASNGDVIQGSQTAGAAENGHQEGDLVAVASDFAKKLGGIQTRLEELSVEIAGGENGAKEEGASAAG